MQFLFSLKKSLSKLGRIILFSISLRQRRKKLCSHFTEVKASKRQLLEALGIISEDLRQVFSGPSQYDRPSRRSICHYSPCITRVFVGKSQDICSSASALIDHHGDRWAGPHILPHHQDHIGASFHHQPNHGYTLALSCFKTHLTSYKQVSITLKKSEHLVNKYS